MELNEIQELIKLLDSTNIGEFKLKTEGFSLLVRTRAYTEALAMSKTVVATHTAMPYPPPPPPLNTLPAPQTVALSQTSNPNTQSETTDTTAATESSDAGLITVKSPMVGTFYRSSKPDKDPYVKIGDSVAKGSVLCIIEAMKLFNEIESEYSGQIVKVLVEDSSPVAYDQPLFLIKSV